MSPSTMRRAAGRVLRDLRSEARFALQRVRYRRMGNGPAVLIVDQLEPDPRLGAGYPRAFALIAELVDLRCRVAFYATEATRGDVERMAPAFGGAVHFFPPAGAAGLQRVLRRHGASFDILVISRPTPMTAYADGDWRPAARGRPFVVYDAEAVLSPRDERRRALFGGEPDKVASAAALEAELAPVMLADAVSAVGPGDAAIIADAVDKPVVVLSHLVVPRLDTPGFGSRADILFVGRMTGTREQSPNVDSVVWFATEVMPALDRLIGTGYRLHLVGLQHADEIAALISDRIVAHGMVDDVLPFYDGCRVFVAPTRYSAGIPLKLVETMGNGIPSVATPPLGQALGTSDDALPTGSSAEEFARQCARLFGDERAWSATREAALRFVGDHYSRAAFRASIERMLALADRPAR